MQKIKDYLYIFLVLFIIATVLYAIHLFRYEYIDKLNEEGFVLRIDRITNEVCYSIVNLNEYKLGTDMSYPSTDSLENKIFLCYLSENDAE